ncbi:hypothetical protein [Brochothrix thermosphacta]|uniref:hypothetical protein n=1 Tax=Brochothrix thermosphacta TaxID=2756 RepID=UPI000D790264|nr:hypothetical protein [Brochothrix thermosphacta]SPN75624.1 hypothetical protein BTEBP_260014 [Brochothrix thermosphacta]
MARRVKIMDKAIDLAMVRDIFYSNEFKKTTTKKAKDAMDHKALVSKIKAVYGLTEDNAFDASLIVNDADFIYGDDAPEAEIMSAAMAVIKDPSSTSEIRKKAFYSMLDVYKLKRVNVPVAQKTLTIEYKEYKMERPRTSEGWGERQKVYKREKYIVTEDDYKTTDKILKKFHGEVK